MRDRQARDVRLDLFRGLALLVIFINHVGGNPLAKVTPSRLGPSDAAEVFVFISGFAVALAYGPVLAERGWRACQGKALARCRQLWVANGVTMLACAAVVATAVFGGGLSMADSHRLASFSLLFEEPLTALSWSALLLYLPYAFDILALYILLMAAAPLYLWLYRRTGIAAFLLPLLLYGVAQAAPGFVPPNLWGGRWNFNPLAWQVVFFLGTTMGLVRNGDGAGGGFVRWRTPLLWLSLAVLLAMTLWKGVAADAVQARLPEALAAWLPADGIPLADKESLGPMRLLHFIALACAAALLVPRGAGWLGSAPARLLSVCGRHALPVFCAGLFLSFCGTVVLMKAPGMAAALAVNLGGVAAMLLLATALERRRLQRRSARAPASGYRRAPEAS
ncbi:OpgC family protein [Azospirillum agricola]|uniref:OpgC family protein n=1 Tax=Azospirillum agricola TaxID=1720247 RepID=UPI000A0EEFCB|nr:OpgC domain-containing protein [Azospirillum agricola]SMH54287.1 hypothetical protein SAMN02982994_3529 [Azospirillum lipoferum]